MFKKIRRYLRDPYYEIGYDLVKRNPKYMSDKYYIKVLWKQIMGSRLNLKTPVAFNEKLQWLKLYDHNPIYPYLVDKLEAKRIVGEKIGYGHIVPTIKEYAQVNDIVLDELPNQFVLKCNHDSGGYVICKDKSTFDLRSAQTFLQSCMNRNFYWEGREWAYKRIVPRLFAEKYIQDDKYDDLLTYKFLCFNGEPRYCYITVKNDDIWENWYDIDFNRIDVRHSFRNGAEITKPDKYDEMVEIARTLSQGIPHVRIDLYLSGEKIYFSEYTFYDWGGYRQFQPASFDKVLGDSLVLPTTK